MHYFKITGLKPIRLITITVLTITICLLTSTSFAQKYLYGYEYILSMDENVKIKYTRTYSGTNDIFITIYKIYHPTKGYHAITIKATHYKTDKKIEVEAEEATGGFFSFINKEETTYETPSSKSFGFRGDMGVLGGNRIPNQLMVKFVSAKYENVKVENMLGYHEGNDIVFFVLD